MEVSLKNGLLQREYAVERPKTPLPIIRMDEGIDLSVEPCSIKAIVITWRAECFQISYMGLDDNGMNS